VTPEIDRVVEGFAAAGLAEEDIAGDAHSDEPAEPESPRHRRRRLGEQPPPDIW
jgi:hypothetical protein